MKIYSKEVAEYLWRLRNFLDSERSRQLAINGDCADTGRLETDSIEVSKIANELWEMRTSWGSD